MRTVDALGILIPARRDGENAAATVRAVLASAAAVAVPVTVIIIDDGENDGFGTGLPIDSRLAVVRTTEHGPGFARSAGAADFAARVVAAHLETERCWLVSLDADVALEDDFVATWMLEIERSNADVLCAPAHFGALRGEVALDADVDAASSWMWSDTALYERFAGIVNTGGCNHAVSLATWASNDGYLQPTAPFDGAPLIVAGDDWDFGLRARMRGFVVERVSSPVVVTSTRRIVADAVGFLAGRSYELPFVPIRGAAPAPAWPPAEAWSTIVARGRARLVAHFLLKPILAGVQRRGSLDWFLGEALTKELGELVQRAPHWDGDWNTFRTDLVAMLFEDEVFAYCGRIAQHLSGAVGE
jgi:hypothetical protein